MAGSSEEFPTLEEVQASVKIMMRKESGRQTSNIINQQQHDNNNNSSLRIDIREEDHNAAADSTLAARFKSVMDPQDSESSGGGSSSSCRKWPRIHKVPQMLRGVEDFKMLFEPRVVSLGPYHHHKRELRPGAVFKRRMTRQFILKSSQRIEVLYKKIAREISDLRKCYKKSALRRYNDEDLAWMMLVDGCFVLRYMHCCKENKMEELMTFTDPLSTALVKQDLFLLENQLPFRVLELLFESAKITEAAKITEEEAAKITGAAEWMKSIEQFICGMFNVDYPEAAKITGVAKWMKSIERFICGMFNVDYPAHCIINTVDDEKQKEKPSHLLDLLRRILVGDSRKSGGRPSSTVTSCWNTFPKVDELKVGDPRKCCGWSSRNENSGWNTFRKVDELRASGIAFQSSKSAFLNDVSFHSYTFFGFLRLPKIIVDDSTKSRLLNLIAYEMCPDVSTKSEVTSYVCFIDSLIDDANDVKELRRKHIVRNLLGSDQQVAELFNQITTDLVPNVDAYAAVKADIQKHYENKVNRWVTEGLHNHFSSPWTVLAFLAALLALLMGAVQTWYTIFPARH